MRFKAPIIVALGMLAKGADNFARAPDVSPAEALFFTIVTGILLVAIMAVAELDNP
jgi:hypothetical protein